MNTAPKSALPATPDAERVKPSTQIAYSTSAFAENLALNSINQLANPVFNLTLGVSPVLVGAAIALPRLWDVFLDIWIGNASDQFQSRWGDVARLF